MRQVRAGKSIRLDGRVRWLSPVTDSYETTTPKARTRRIPKLAPDRSRFTEATSTLISAASTLHNAAILEAIERDWQDGGFRLRSSCGTLESMEVAQASFLGHVPVQGHPNGIPLTSSRCRLERPAKSSADFASSLENGQQQRGPLFLTTLSIIPTSASGRTCPGGKRYDKPIPLLVRQT